MIRPAAAIAGALAVLNKTLGRLPAMPPAAGNFANTAGRELHYVDSGGDGVAAVLLHGMSSNHDDFERVVALLPDVRTIAVDRPGYGWSRGGTASFDDQIAAIHGLIEALDVAPVVVVGHSMGATVALGLAHEHPADVAGLVLLAPAAGRCRNGRRPRAQAHFIRFLQLPVVKQLSDLLFNGLLRKALADAALRRAFGPDGVDGAHRRRVLAVTLSDGNLVALARDRLEFNAIGEWLDPRSGEIRAPATIVAGRVDTVIPLRVCRRLAKMLPDAHVVEVDCGHTVPHSCPADVAREIRHATRRAATTAKS